MKTTLTIPLLLTLILHPVSAIADSTFGYPNRYSSIAESIFDMMDAFSSAFQRKKREYAWNNTPYHRSPPGYTVPSYPPMQGKPYYAPPNPWIGRLNGQWQGSTGEVLIVRQDRFRIYRDEYNYFDGYLFIADSRFLILQDALSGNGRQYAYTEQEGRLALQDEMGNILLFVWAGY